MHRVQIRKSRAARYGNCRSHHRARWVVHRRRRHRVCYVDMRKSSDVNQSGPTALNAGDVPSPVRFTDMIVIVQGLTSPPTQYRLYG